MQPAPGVYGSPDATARRSLISGDIKYALKSRQEAKEIVRRKVYSVM